MKVLHLETGRHLYGGARQVAWLMRGLAARHVDNLLICPPGHPLTTEVRDARIVELPVSGDFDFSLRRGLARQIRELRPDLVHVHSRRGADWIGGRAARAAGVPAVLTRRVQSTEPGWWLRWKCRPYAAIAAISSAVEAELVRAGIGRERLQLIPSAVDTGLLRPDPNARARLAERFGLRDEARICGMAAQFIARKGHDLLLPLVRRVRDEVPEFCLLLFGQGPERSRIERAVRAAGLDRVILFGGFAPDWPTLVPGLELLLHPARREGLGVAVLEAMSAGVPVVASAVGGIVEAVTSGVDGELLPPADVAAWTQTVVRLLRDASARERLAGAARSRVESAYTIERMAGRYLDIYCDIVNQHA